MPCVVGSGAGALNIFCAAARPAPQLEAFRRRGGWYDVGERGDDVIIVVERGLCIEVFGAVEGEVEQRRAELE